MKNKAPHQNAHLHNKNPSPACGRGVGVRAFVCRTNPAFTPLGGPSNRAAWRTQQPRRLANPAFIPLGESSNRAAWRGQCLSRLVRCQSQILHGKIPSPACGRRWPKAGRGDKKPGFIPLGGPSNHAAWRVQQPRRLTGPATTSLDESSNPSIPNTP